MDQLGAIALLMDLFKVLVVVVAISGFIGVIAAGLLSNIDEIFAQEASSAQPENEGGEDGGSLF